MDSGLTSEAEQQKKNRSIAEAFDEAFPQYLAMGMTSEQFWDQDCALVMPFREAYRIRQEKENYLAWLQGMYIYDAFASVIGQAFAKRGQRVEPYPSKPYDFAQKKKKTKAEQEQEKKENTISFMEKLAARFNQQFSEKKNQQESGSERSEKN